MVREESWKMLMGKTIYIFTIILMQLLLCLGTNACQSQPAMQINAPAVPQSAYKLQGSSAANKDYLECFHYEEKGFLRTIEKAAPYHIEGTMLAATSPHFLPVMSFTANILSTLAKEEQLPSTVFVLAPNHSGEGLPIIVADKGWSTPFGALEFDEDATAAILKSPQLAGKTAMDQLHLQNDHSAATLMPFIKYYLPESQVVTILLSKDCRLEQVDILAKIIYETSLRKPVFVLGSVDFSHYLQIEETARRDDITDVLVQEGKTQAIMALDSGNMDSPQTMCALINYAARFPNTEVQRLEHIILPESDIIRDIGYSYSVYAYINPRLPNAKPADAGDAGHFDAGLANSGLASTGLADSGLADSGLADFRSAERSLGQVILDGSTANIPLAELLLERYYGISAQAAAAQINFHRTSASYRYLVDKQADLLLVNVADQDTQYYLDHCGVELEYYPIRRDALCFIVNELNPVNDLSHSDIKNIYAGRVGNWQKVGGNDNSIVAYQRNEDSGSQALMRELVLAGEELAKVPPALIPAEMGLLLDSLANHNKDGKAIGYCTYYYASVMHAKKGLKFLAVDGVSPTNESISQGIYPFINEYSIVIRADEAANSPVRHMLAWLLSPAGSRLVEDLGYVPVPRDFSGAPKPQAAVLMFTGDLMCVYQTKKSPLPDGGVVFDAGLKKAFNYVKPILAQCDLAVGNLETMLSATAPYKHEQAKISSPNGLQYNCNAPAAYLEALCYAGFGALVTANNHNLDAGLIGIEETLAGLERFFLPHTGMFKDKDERRFLLFELNGLNIALLSYATAFNTFDSLYSKQDLNIHINKYERKKAAMDIMAAKRAGADFVVVFIHWGKQNSSLVTENQFIYAQELADAGADYIVGGHPHVLNPYSRHQAADGRQVPVIYSLGNFFADMNEVGAINRDAVIWRLELKKEAQVTKIASEGYIPCHIFLDFEGQPCVTVPCSTPLANLDALNELEKARERIRRALGENINDVGAVINRAP
ncbi:MAG: AmmeMemoRadiSam system protein B [Clostridiales bacterium]|nr:AmmeMemoRadiSam system protein B [Clostridiales bacterium]